VTEPSRTEPIGSPTPTEAAAWRPVGFIERIGAALVAPRSALAEADSEHASGTAGSDIAMLIGLAFVAVYAREIAFTLWVATAESMGDGLRSLAGVISGAVATDLAVLFVAGFGLTLAAGRKRALGRDFDLVCVAFIPIIAVRLVAELVVHVAGVPFAGVGHSLVATLAYGWAGALLFLAWRTARSRAPNTPDDIDDIDSRPEAAS
jgi:type IV secretory pathway VirB2 component (pilin)